MSNRPEEINSNCSKTVGKFTKKSDYGINLLKQISSIILVVFVSFVAVAAQTPQATPPPNQPTAPPTQQQTEIQQQNRQQTQQNNPPTNQPTTNPAQTNPSQTVTQPVQPSQPGVTPSGQIPNPGAVLPTSPTQNVGTSGGIAPAELPENPPPIAPDFQAPIRPLPSADRVGVDNANQMPMTLEEAIEMALQNSNDI